MKIWDKHAPRRDPKSLPDFFKLLCKIVEVQKSTNKGYKNNDICNRLIRPLLLVINYVASNPPSFGRLDTPLLWASIIGCFSSLASSNHHHHHLFSHTVKLQYTST